MKVIALTKGKETIVDDEDIELLSKYRWHYTHLGYARCEFRKNGKRVRILLHRLLMNAQRGQILDHINGDRLDNRRANLRFVTQSQNNQNRVGTGKNLSGYKGVYWNVALQKWYARVQVNKVNYYGGTFSSKHEAARMYNQLATKHLGQYARLNKVV